MYIRRSGSYLFQERDSARNYTLCSGKAILHRFESDNNLHPGVNFWIELRGWWEPIEDKQPVTFLGRDTIFTYPGGENFGVSDALGHTFVRDHSEPGSSELGQPPPRIEEGEPGSYWVRLPPRLRELLWKDGPFYQWSDGQYPGIVRASYDYTNSQVPSAVIGDFDGDNLADVAIYGSTGYEEGKFMCIVSNRGDPRAVLLLREPTVFEPDVTSRRYQRPRPGLYLRLVEAGRPIDQGGGRTLPFDAILVVRPTGEGMIYYYEDGSFRTISSPRQSPWLPTPEPRR